MADWNETTDEIKRGTGPESREWAVRDLVADFPNRKGIPDRSRADAELIVDALLGAPEPWMAGWDREDMRVMSAEAVVEWASKNGFLYRTGNSGWMDRSGKMYVCHYATHEKLLNHVLKMETPDAEAAGWARVSHAGVKCQFRLSREQRAALAKLGHGTDLRGEREKPEWEPPADSATPAPR